MLTYYPKNQNQLPTTHKEFIECLPYFREVLRYDYDLRRYYNKLLIGLSLPCAIDRRPQLWGYEKHTPENPAIPQVWLPIEYDLRIFNTGYRMYKSKEYRVLDVIKWINDHPITSNRIGIDTFYFIVNSRLWFKDALRPLEQRIQIFHDITRFRDTPTFFTSKKGKSKHTPKEENEEKEFQILEDW